MGTDFGGKERILKEFLFDKLTKASGLDRHSISLDQPFSYFGLDSLKAVEISADLEKVLGYNVSPTLVWDYPSINLAIEHLLSGNQNNDDSTRITKEDISSEPIAIIGMGCRFPGAENIDIFWENLKSGKESIQPVPSDRWNKEEYYDDDVNVSGKMNTKWGGFLKDIDKFDAKFFGISPREAVKMDPQQRLLLEVAWQSLEDAGQVPNDLLDESVGVFVGISNNDYAHLLRDQSRDGDPYFGTGNSLSIAANRISYVFGFRGPSIAIDTACSSSLVAVYQACQSIWSGESSIAIAGGVNLILTPDVTVDLSKAGILSSDGKCKTFDESANGYVRGEGAGLVVLKPYSRALEDGDQIYSVIRGGAINNNGKSNGIIAPNGESQRLLLNKAYKNAGLEPKDVQYIETHGTATKIGDPIEVNALGKVIKNNKRFEEKCAIGSVKTNIGHLESAAGIASLIKVALMIKNKTLTPSLNIQKLNPLISFDKFPIYVQQEKQEWENGNKPLRAGVSSFGFGGTNCHIVMEEYIGKNTNSSIHNYNYQETYVLPISGKSPNALNEIIKRYLEFMNGNEKHETHNFCYTCSVKKAHFNHRIAFLGKNKSDFKKQMKEYLETECPSRINEITDKRDLQVLLVYRDLDIIPVQIIKDLLKKEKVFRKCWEDLDKEFIEQLKWSAWEIFSLEKKVFDERKPYIQFIFQVCLTELLTYWGVSTKRLLGYGLGELAASYVLGDHDIKKVICSIKTRKYVNKVGAIDLLKHDKLENYYVIELASNSKILNVNYNQVNNDIYQSFGDIKNNMIKSLYENGFGLNWKNIYISGEMEKLPGYPFERNKFWLDTKLKAFNKGFLDGSNIDRTPVLVEQTNNMINYYGNLAEKKSDLGEFLSFAPFIEKDITFSWLLTLTKPEDYPENFKKTSIAQEKMRQILFKNVDFSFIDKVAEFGCGYSTDLIRLASRYPHLNLHGFNISKEQLKIGYDKIKANKLDRNIALYNTDVVREELPDYYDLIYCIQLIHHIKNKEEIFNNINKGLNDGGLLVLAEMISNINEQINHPQSSAYFTPKEEWASILADQHLKIVECIDVSKEIGLFLDDPNFYDHLEKLFSDDEKTVIDHLEGPHLLGELLRRKAVLYGLFTIQKVPYIAIEKIRDDNLERLTHPTMFVNYTAQDALVEKSIDVLEVSVNSLDELENYLIKIVSRVLEFREGDVVDPSIKLDELGLDSITAIDLKKTIETELNIQLSIGDLLKGPSIEILARQLCDEMENSPLEMDKSSEKKLELLARNTDNIQDIFDNLDGLGDDEINHLLDKYQYVKED
ncbi:3-oxoacyl-(acyl-carrier-protein) synthase/acyl carrier protein/SAM-dependent methyltransferase [Alkalihalobacillus xiaoxiensis]|uniref:3-oxoacyl-(Acyl-carrier-protein) synthase/acyl carrier protein/SAM-dependent methyltransferase n=1 Tax=Shouchella xiaoxiensis TaxID=766895 RepID=A0ABS2SUE4_9BACI|nr:beta-ketoacyl synthase N-terminal-like domain-containing protein [Shouchella xiaoxiensis]MBM7839128.1 3-oxoacyl-(acyl-carrier-protein) synthase/acyl carrier protein/SAM-dependent methyltransferase [Shouchella xiaoxiensis]